VGSDTAALTITNNSATGELASKTVSMQKTGSPLTFLVLVLAFISGGLIFSRR